MNEKYIQQVLEIEDQAQALHDAAIRESEQIVQKAVEESQSIVDQAKAEAQEEARRMIAQSQAEDETKHILEQAEKEAHSTEALATTHLERAVAYVLKRVIGRE